VTFDVMFVSTEFDWCVMPYQCTLTSTCHTRMCRHSDNRYSGMLPFPVNGNIAIASMAKSPHGSSPERPEGAEPQEGASDPNDPLRTSLIIAKWGPNRATPAPPRHLSLAELAPDVQ